MSLLIVMVSLRAAVILFGSSSLAVISDTVPIYGSSIFLLGYARSFVFCFIPFEDFMKFLGQPFRI